MKHIVISFLLVLASGCNRSPAPEATVPGRWYTASQVAAGAPLYATYCAACHAADGSATADWRTPDASGNYPPPPLNGSAHTWHHPLVMLDQTIAEGGAPYNGVMPGFGAVLAPDERLAVIAWFQSLWSDDIYRRWLAIEDQSR